MATFNTDLGTLIAAIYDSTEEDGADAHRDSLAALATYEILCEHQRRSLAAQLLVESVGAEGDEGYEEEEVEDVEAVPVRSRTLHFRRPAYPSPVRVGHECTALSQRDR